MRDWEGTGEFYDKHPIFVNTLKELLRQSGFIEDIVIDGDWDDGSCYIHLKPSDEILRLAKTKGF